MDDFRKTRKFDAFVASGGGVKAIWQLGALSHYEQLGLIDFQEYSGTSAGSMVSLLHLIGYPAVDIFASACEMGVFFAFTNFYDLMQKQGFLKFDLIYKHLEKLVERKLKKSPTFAELYHHTKKEFYVSAVNKKKNILVRFSHHTFPDVKVLDAIKASCAIPFIFERVNILGEPYVDGGVLDNFPHKPISSHRKILGVLTDGIYVGSSFIDDVISLISLTINQITNLGIVECRKEKEIEIVRMYSEKYSIIDVSIKKDIKFDMFLDGVDTAKIVTSKRRVTLNFNLPSPRLVSTSENSKIISSEEGWEWDEWS